jgi:hypothetical protein
MTSIFRVWFDGNNKSTIVARHEKSGKKIDHKHFYKFIKYIQILYKILFISQQLKPW